MSKLSEKISLIVPTLNRFSFVIRLLEYYSKTQFRGQILIGDSGGADEFEKLQRAIPRFQEHLTVKHYPCPQMNEPQTSSFLVAKVETPFVALLPDDDFLVPSGLEKGIDFLEQHSDYSVAHGLTLRALFGDVAMDRKLRLVEPHVGAHDILDFKAKDRLFHFTSRFFSLLYGVHRSNQMKEAYQRITEMADKGIVELFVSSFFALQGNVKKLDCLYLVRQIHTQRYVTGDYYDWVFGDQWLPSYKICFQELVKKLMSQDTIPEQAAKDVVKKSLWVYLMNAGWGHWRFQYEPRKVSWKDQLRMLLRTIPVLSQLGKKFSSYLPSRETSLPALLRPSSPYHHDFLPIYEILAQ